MSATLLNLLAIQLGAGASARFAAILWVLSTGVGLVLLLWLVRGVWTAAGRRIAEGRGVDMAYAARATVLLGSVGAVGLYSAHVSNSGELWEVMRGDQPGSAPKVRISEDGKTGFFHGGIQDGAAALLRGKLREYPGVTRIVLTSAGGWIEEGVRLAEVIRERELDTHVESACLSACVIVFSAGKERTASRRARLGFHRPKSAFLEGAALKKAEQAFRDAGIPNWIIERAYATPHESMWYPGIDALMEEGVIMGLREFEVLPRTDEIFSLDEYRALLVKREPYQTIAELLPEEFEEITDAAWEASKAGASIAETRYELALAVQEIVADSLPYAGDQTLLSFHDLVIDQFTHLAEVDAAACVRLSFQEEDLGPNFPWPPELVDREVELSAQVIREAAEERPSDPPSMEDVDRVIAAIEAKLTEGQLRLHDEEDAWMEASKEEACSAGRAFQHATRDLPPADRLLVLRYMMSED